MPMAMSKPSAIQPSRASTLTSSLSLPEAYQAQYGAGRRCVEAPPGAAHQQHTVDGTGAAAEGEQGADEEGEGGLHYSRMVHNGEASVHE